MEPAICEELFAKDKYKVMIGGEDSSSEARVKKNINADIEKWADVNHVKRTLGKTLHDSKVLDFGPGNDRLTDQVKEYVLYCFSIAFSQNKGNVLGLQHTIRSMFLTPSEITNCVEIGLVIRKTRNLSAMKTYLVVKIWLDQDCKLS